MVWRGDEVKRPMAIARIPAKGSTLAQCGATGRLTPAYLHMLATLPHLIDLPLRRLACELVAGHDGSHVAFTVAAHDGDQWWWLRWTASQDELTPLDRCDVEQAEVANPDYCMLPIGHDGPHSFQIRPFSARLV
jgi:hypothetical protein